MQREYRWGSDEFQLSVVLTVRRLHAGDLHLIFPVTFGHGAFQPGDLAARSDVHRISPGNGSPFDALSVDANLKKLPRQMYGYSA